MLNIVLSFDDGRKDNYRVAKELLIPYGIPATFNITLGYILDDIEKNEMPGPHEPMSISDLIELSGNDLFEIAGHGYRHNNDIINLVNGVIKLREILPGVKINGIASPRSELNLNELQNTEKIFSENRIEYVRISNDYTRIGKFKKIIRRANRITNIPYIYRWVNKDSLIDEPTFLLHSFPVIRDTSLREVISLVNFYSNKYMNEDKTCIFMFHSILKPNEDFYKDLFSWDYEDFCKLCEYLSVKAKDGLIHMCQTKDLFNKCTYENMKGQ